VITVRVYTILALKQILGQREIEVSLPPGSTVRDLIAWMIDRWGDALSARLLSPGTDSPLPQTRFMLNGRSIEFLNGMDTVLREGDEFQMLPLVSGG
jgi:molybdopterin synthase sulfur carrier subunit